MKLNRVASQVTGTGANELKLFAKVILIIIILIIIIIIIIIFFDNKVIYKNLFTVNFTFKRAAFTISFD